MGALAGAVGFAIVGCTALYSEESSHGPAGMMLCAAVTPSPG